jgi:hypothetical protein
MRITRSNMLGAVLLATLWLAVPARAEGDDVCAVPDYLLKAEHGLPKVEAAYKAKQPINILVVGSKSSALAGPDGVASSYPARLEAILRDKFPGIDIHVVTELRNKETAVDVAAEFEKIIGDHKPTLVIWQTGTVDAMRSIDPDDFRSGLDDGIALLQKSGNDVVLMNLQYSPRVETLLAAAAYVDTMRVVAEQRGIPLFDRFSIMRAWSESGNFDLFGSHGSGVAKRVHECLGQALSKLIVADAHMNSDPGIR